MNALNIYSIISTILFVVLGFLYTYFRSKEKVVTRLSEFIAKAEEMYKDVKDSGGKKLNLVVALCLDKLPPFLKPFISKQMIEELVQKTFDYMEDYATLQLDKITDKIPEKSTDAKPI